ncbi:MAG: hypothetical protein Q9187_001629, partial [Circinaria calcarea]
PSSFTIQPIMWSRITGKSQVKGEDARSQTSRRKEEERRSGRHRSESMVSSTSARKPPRGDDRDRGFNPISSSFSSTSRTPYPGTAAASVASSYATASSNQADIPMVPPDLVRNSSLAGRMPRANTAYELQDGDEDQYGKSNRRRERSTNRDRNAEKVESSRSLDREGAKREKREKRDKKSEKDRGLRRSESGYQGDKGKTRAHSMSGSFGAQVGRSDFTQFPGQYDGGMPGFPSAASHPQPTMSAHIQDQFPGQFPIESTAPYRPPVAASEGGLGLAAEYYGDAGESVAHQPGVRPQAPSLIVGAEPHLQPASSIAAPPPEPSASGGVGAAASFFSGNDDFQSLPPAPPSKAGSKTRPMNSNQPGMNSGPFASTGSTALGYATGSHHKTTSSQSTMNHSTSSMQKPTSDLPPGSSYPSSSVPTTSSYHSSSAPVIPTLGAAVAGAAAGYAIGNHSSSHNQDHMTSHITGSSYTGKIPTDPQRPPAHAQSSQGSFPNGGETFTAAGAVGAAGLAAAAYHNKYHTSTQSSHTTHQYPSGSMAQKHRQHGPLDKFVDFWRDPYGVARFEEYTEYIGVCKYCFAPGSSPRDAPRKHHYRRRGSNERFGSSIRVDKDSRYWSSDGESRRRKGKSWLAAGLAGYGLSKVGKSLFAAHDDYEHTYSVRSGRVNESRTSLRDRHHSSSPDRRSYTSRGVTRRPSAVSSSHRNYSRERIETGVTSDGKLHRKDHHGSSSGGYSITTYDARPRSRSRSRSKGRRSSPAKAALGVTVASSVMAVNLRKHSHSPKMTSTRPTQQRKENSPELRSVHSVRNSQSKHTDDQLHHSPTASYVDIRRSRLSPEPGILGGFFSAASEKPRYRHKKNKKKGFFSFGNSSSSSTDLDLAFGSGVDHFRNKKQPKAREKKTNSNNSNSALLGLGAAAAVLAANEARKNNNSKRKADVVAVKKSRSAHGRRSEQNLKGSLISGPSGVDEDLWESASEDDDASIDYALAYGALHRESQESLRSDSSGTSKWNWRWGSKKKRGNVSPRESQSVPFVGMAVPLAGAALAARHDHQETVSTSTSSLPPLQHVYPMPTSDPSHFDVVRQNSMGSDNWPITTSRPAPIPLQQPQPLPLVSPAVYTTPVSYGHSYSAPDGPPVFSQVSPSSVLHAHPATYRDQLPENIPGGFPIMDYQPEARSNELVYNAKSKPQEFSPTSISNIPSKGKRTTNRDDSSGVRFDLPEQREDTERRDRKDMERKGQEDMEHMAREDMERRDRKDRERKDRKDRERKDREDKERRDQEARERRDQEARERRDQEAREHRDQEDREHKARKDKEHRDQEARDQEAREHRDREDKERRDREDRENINREDRERRDRGRQKREEEDKRRESERREAGYQAEVDEQRRLKRVADLTAEEIDRDLELLERKPLSSEPTNSNPWPLPALAGVTDAAIGPSIVDRQADKATKQSANREKQQRWDNDQEHADSGEVDYSSGLRFEQELRAKREAKIARQAAARIRPTPAPEHESYAEFFVPPDLHAEKSPIGPDTENASSLDQTPQIITIEPAASREVNEEMEEKDSPLPLYLPQINMILQLTQPTPPASFAGSVRTSPMMRANDGQESDIEDNHKPRTNSRVSFGGSEHVPVIPLDHHGEFIEPISLEHDTQHEQAQRGVGIDSGIPIHEEVISIEVQRADHVPGGFDDDIDFAATVAAGLEDTGFDPAIVIDDPNFRRRDSPPETEQFVFHQSPFFETVRSTGIDSPGTEGAPPVSDFIVGELPPTPKEEIMPAATEGIVDESSAHISAEKREEQGKKIVEHQSTEELEDATNGFATPSRQAKVFGDHLQHSVEQDLPTFSKRGPTDDLEAFNKPKSSKPKKSKKGSTRSDPGSSGATPVLETNRDDFFDVPEIPTPTPQGMRPQNLQDIAMGVPLPDEGMDDLDPLVVKSGKGASTISLEDRDMYDFGSDDETDSIAASAPMPGNFEEPKRSKKKSKRRTSEYDEVGSSFSSPAAFDNTTQPNGKSKKDNKGGIFGLFTRSTDDLSKKNRSKDTPKESTLESFEETKKKGKRSKDHRSAKDDDVVRSRASKPVADLNHFNNDDFEEPKKKSKKSKDRKSRYDEDDVRSRASEPASTLTAFDDDDKNEDRKSRKSWNKEDKRRSRQDDAIQENSGRITQDLPAKVYMPASPGHPLPELSQESLTNPEDPILIDSEDQNKPHVNKDDREKDKSIAISDENQPLSFLGERQEMERPPDEAGTLLPHKSVQTYPHFRDLPKLEPMKDILPPLPESRPTSPMEVGKLDDLPSLPLSRPTSPATTPSGHRRHLSMLQLSEVSHPGSSPSPTAVPLFFRKPPSAGFSRSSPSTPAASSQSAASFTPRQRQPRPSSTEFKTSTEFRPLWLVERHSARQIPPLNEVYPSLPSSHSTSRASSVHDPEDLDPFDDVKLGSDELDILAEPDLIVDTHRNTRSDFLDSQQATPTAASFQFKEIAYDDLQDGQAPIYEKELGDILAGDELEGQQIHGVPQRITHSVDDLFPDLRAKSPSRYDLEGHGVFSTLPLSRPTSSHDSYSVDEPPSATREIATDALTSAASLELSQSTSYPQNQPVSDNDRNPAPESNYESSTKKPEESSRSIQVGEEGKTFVSTNDKRKKDKKRRKDGKVLQEQHEPRTTSSSVTVVTNPDVKPLSLDDRQIIEEKDAQDAVDSWFAPSSLKKRSKEKTDKRKDRGINIPENSSERLVATDSTDELINPVSTSKDPVLTSNAAPPADLVEEAKSTKSGYEDTQLAQEEATRAESLTKDVPVVEAVVVMAASAVSAAASLVGPLRPSASKTQAKDDDRQGIAPISKKGQIEGAKPADQISGEAALPESLSEDSTGQKVLSDDSPDPSSLAPQIEEDSWQDISSKSQKVNDKHPALEPQASPKDNPQLNIAFGPPQDAATSSIDQDQSIVNDRSKRSKKGKKKSGPSETGIERGLDMLPSSASSSSNVVETKMGEQQLREPVLLKRSKKDKKGRESAPLNYLEEPVISSAQVHSQGEKSKPVISDFTSNTTSEVVVDAGHQNAEARQAISSTDSSEAASSTNTQAVSPEEIPLPPGDDPELPDTLPRSATIDQDTVKVEAPGVVLPSIPPATLKENQPSTHGVHSLTNTPPETSGIGQGVAILENSLTMIPPIDDQSPNKVPLPVDDDLDLLPTLPASPNEVALPDGDDLDLLPTLPASPNEVVLPDDDNRDISPQLSAGPNEVALPDDGEVGLIPTLPASPVIKGKVTDVNDIVVPVSPSSPITPEKLALPDGDDKDLFDTVPLLSRSEFQDTIKVEYRSTDNIPNPSGKPDLVTFSERDSFTSSLKQDEEHEITQAPQRQLREEKVLMEAIPTPHTAQVSETPFFEAASSLPLESRLRDNSNDYFTMAESKSRKKRRNGRQSQPTTPYAGSEIGREDFETPMELPPIDNSRFLQTETPNDTPSDNHTPQPVGDEWALPIKKGKKGKNLKAVDTSSSSPVSKNHQEALLFEQEDPILLTSGSMEPLDDHSTREELDYKRGDNHENLLPGNKMLQASSLPSPGPGSLIASDSQIDQPGLPVTSNLTRAPKDKLEEPAADNNWGFPTKRKGKKVKKSKEVEAGSVPNTLNDQQNLVEPNQTSDTSSITNETRNIIDQESTPVLDVTSFDETIPSQGGTANLSSRKKGRKLKKGDQASMIEAKEPDTHEAVQTVSIESCSVSSNSPLAENSEESSMSASKKNKKSQRKALSRTVGETAHFSNFPDQVQNIEETPVSEDLRAASTSRDFKPVSDEVASQEPSGAIRIIPGTEDSMTTKAHSQRLYLYDKAPSSIEAALLEHPAAPVEQRALNLLPTAESAADKILQEARMTILPTEDMQDFPDDHRTNHEAVTDSIVLGTGESKDARLNQENEPLLQARTSGNADDVILREAISYPLPSDNLEHLREDLSLQDKTSSSHDREMDGDNIIMASKDLEEQSSLRGARSQEDAILDEASKAKLPPDDVDSYSMDESAQRTTVIESSATDSSSNTEIGASQKTRFSPVQLDLESQEEAIFEEAKNAVLPFDIADSYTGDEGSQYIATAPSSNIELYGAGMQQLQSVETQPAVSPPKSRENISVEESGDSVLPADKIEEPLIDPTNQLNKKIDRADNETVEDFRLSPQAIPLLMNQEESQEDRMLHDAVALALPANTADESYGHHAEVSTTVSSDRKQDTSTLRKEPALSEIQVTQSEEDILLNEAAATVLPPDAEVESLENLEDKPVALDELRTLDESEQVQPNDFPSRITKKSKKTRKSKASAWDDDSASAEFEEQSLPKLDATLSETARTSQVTQPQAESSSSLSKEIKASTEAAHEPLRSKRDKKKSKKAQALNWAPDVEIAIPNESLTASASAPAPSLPTDGLNMVDNGSQNVHDSGTLEKLVALSGETVPDMNAAVINDKGRYPVAKVKERKRKGKGAQALNWDGHGEATVSEKSSATTELSLPLTLESNLDIPPVLAQTTEGLGNIASVKKGKKDKKSKKSQALSWEDDVKALEPQVSSTKELDLSNPEASPETSALPGDGNAAEITFSSDSYNLLGTEAATATITAIQEKGPTEVVNSTEPNIDVKGDTTAMLGDPMISAKQYPVFPEIEIPDSQFSVNTDGDSADVESFSLKRSKKDKKSKRVRTVDPGEEPNVAVNADPTIPVSKYPEFPEIELSDSENITRTVIEPTRFATFDSKKPEKNKKGKKVDMFRADNDSKTVRADPAVNEGSNVTVKDFDEVPANKNANIEGSEKLQAGSDDINISVSKKGKKDKKKAKKTQLADWDEEPESGLPESFLHEGVIGNDTEVGAQGPLSLPESSIIDNTTSQNVATKSDDEAQLSFEISGEDKTKAKKALLPLETQRPQLNLSGQEIEASRTITPDVLQSTEMGQQMLENLQSHEVLEKQKALLEPESRPEQEILRKPKVLLESEVIREQEILPELDVLQEQEPEVQENLEGRQEPADPNLDRAIEPSVVPSQSATIIPKQSESQPVDTSLAEDPENLSMNDPPWIPDLQDREAANVKAAPDLRDDRQSEPPRNDMLLQEAKADTPLGFQKGTLLPLLPVTNQVETLPETNPSLSILDTTRDTLEKQPDEVASKESRIAIQGPRDVAPVMEDASFSSESFIFPTHDSPALDSTTNTKTEHVAISDKAEGHVSIVPEAIVRDKFIGFTSKKKSKKDRKKGHQEIPPDASSAIDSGLSTQIEPVPPVEGVKSIPAAASALGILAVESIVSKDEHGHSNPEEVPLVRNKLGALPDYDEDFFTVRQESILRAEERIPTEEVKYGAEENDKLPSPDGSSAFNMGTRKKGKNSKRQKPLLWEDDIIAPPTVLKSGQTELRGSPSPLPASEAQPAPEPSGQEHDSEDVCVPPLDEPLQSQESIAIKQDQVLKSNDLKRGRIQDNDEEYQITSGLQSSDTERFQEPDVPPDVESEQQGHSHQSDTSHGESQIPAVSSPGYLSNLAEARGIVQKAEEAPEASWALPVTRSKKSKKKQSEPFAAMGITETNFSRSPGPVENVEDQITSFPMDPPAETSTEAAYLPKEQTLDNQLSGLAQHKDQEVSTVAEPEDVWDLLVTKKSKKPKRSKNQRPDRDFITESADLPLHEEIIKTEQPSLDLPKADVSDLRNNPEVYMVQAPPIVQSSVDLNKKEIDENLPSSTAVMESEQRSSNGFSGRARATSTVGAGIALFEGLQRAESAPKGKKTKKERKGSRPTDRDETNFDPSSTVKGEGSKELATQEPVRLEQDPDNGPKDISMPLNSSLEQPSSLETSAFQPAEPDKSAYRDSGVHVIDSPVLLEGWPVRNSLRDSGYQGTEESPRIDVDFQGQKQETDEQKARPSSDGFSRQLPYDIIPSQIAEAYTAPGTDRSSMPDSSENPFNISIEVDPTYDVSISRAKTDRNQTRKVSIVQADEHEKEDHEGGQRSSIQPELPVGSPRQPSPVDSTTKDRSSILFQSSPSTREEGVDYAATYQPLSPRQAYDQGEPVAISIPLAESSQSLQDNSPRSIEGGLRGVKPISLFGGPLGVNSDLPTSASSPRTPLDSEDSRRGKLNTIIEYSPEESPLHKKSRDISDVGLRDYGPKAARHSATPQSLLHHRVRSPLASDERDKGPISTDDILSRLSWPAVDEENHSVDLDRSLSRNDHSERRTSSRQSNVSTLAIDPHKHPEPERRSFSGASIRSGESIHAIIRTPDQLRSASGLSNRSSGTPPLRRVDRSVSGDLRAANKRSEAKTGAKRAEADNLGAEPYAAIPSSSTYDPVTDKGKKAISAMADVYEGWGDVHGSPRSPTRPPSMRRRQSMQILDLETRLDQLVSENRLLQDARARAERNVDDAAHDHSREKNALTEALQTRDLYLKQKDSELSELRDILDRLHHEVSQLTEVNEGLTGARQEFAAEHQQRYDQLAAEHTETHRQLQDSTRELEELKQKHTHLSTGVEGIVRHEVTVAIESKNLEIRQLRDELLGAKEQVRLLQQQILASKPSDDLLTSRDEDYFDSQCQQLCQHVQQWVLRFSKFSDMRACRRTSEVSDEKVIDRFDNAILDGSDVDIYLADRVKRRDVFMSVVMTMVWEYVFTRYLFGMDREQRQKLKSLEKTLSEVGPMRAVNKWRATTLVMLSRRDAFRAQRAQDTEAVVQEIFRTLAVLLPPPSHLVNQIQESLRNVMRAA